MAVKIDNLEYLGLDSWNRMHVKEKDKDIHYCFVDTLFDDYYEGEERFPFMMHLLREDKIDLYSIDSWDGEPGFPVKVN